MRRLVLLCLFAACGGALTGPMKTAQVGDAIQPFITGRSLDDCWAAERFAPSGTPTVGVGHTKGGGLWKSIVLPTMSGLDATAIAHDVNGLLWAVGRTSAGGLSVVRVHTDGAIDDFSAPFGGRSATGLQTVKAAGAGAFFSTSFAQGSSSLASLWTSDGTGAATEVPGLPAALEAQVLAVVGPADVYLWLSAVDGSAFWLEHLVDGVFTKVQAMTTATPVMVGTAKDLWLYERTLSEGSTLWHFDGTTWHPLTLTGWPASVKNTMLNFAGLLPSGGGQASLLISAVRTGEAPNDKGEGKLQTVHIGADGKLGPPVDVLSCPDPGECTAALAGVLDDGTTVVLSQSSAQWFTGRVAATP